MELTAFRTLGRVLPDALLLLDDDARVLAATPAAEALLPALTGRDGEPALADLVEDGADRIAVMLSLAARTVDGLPGALVPRPGPGAPAQRLRCTLARSAMADGGLRFVARLEPRAVPARPDAAGTAGRRSQAEQAALLRVARAVAGAVAPEALFDLVAEEVAGLLAVEAGIVWRFEGTASVAVGAFGNHLTMVGARFPLRGGGALPRVWATNRPARVEYEVMPEDDPTRERVESQGYRTGVAAPVHAAGRVWGAVLAATTGDGGIAAGAEERLGRFAELVGLAITSTEDRRALSDRAAEQAVVGRVATAVAAGRPTDDVLGLLCREVAVLTGAAAGGIQRFGGDGTMTVRASWADGPEALPPGTVVPFPGGQPALAARHQVTRTAYDPTRDPPWRAGFGEAVSAAISVAGATWGMFSVAAPPGGVLPRDTEARLRGLADLAGVAITHGDAREEVARQAREQASLRRVATAVADERPPPEVFALVCEEAAELFGARAAFVGGFGPRDDLGILAGWGTPEPWDGSSMPMPDRGAVRALRDGRPARILLGRAELGGWGACEAEAVAAPILLAGRAWGALVVLPGGATALEGGTDERLLAYAELAGVAVTNAAARDALEDEADEQAALKRIALSVAAGADLDDVLAQLCREVGRVIGVASAGMMRFLDDHQAQVVANWTAHGLPAPLVGSVEDLGDRPEAARALRSGGVVHFAPDRTTPGWVGAYHDVIAAPITLGDELWGTLGVASAAGPLPPVVESRLARFADQAGVAIASEEARRRSVHEAAELIAGTSLDTGAALRAIAESARRALFADRVSCLVTEGDGTRITAFHTTEEDPARRAALERGYAEGATNGVPVWRALVEGPDPILAIEDVEVVPSVAHPTALAAYIGIRLEHRGELVGAIVASYKVPRRFAARDRNTLRSLASVAALALVNAQLHGLTLETLADAEQRASTDALTGLANHRVFHERLREEVERARRHGRPLALAIFDLDRFKDVNDRHGHQVGDAILVEVAQRLARQSRPEDLIARLGGEEFAWLLPESDSLDAWQAAERAREAVRGSPFVLGERCTLSAGVAELAQARDASDLVRLADGALYWAKEHGRDVSFRYSPEVVEELSAADRADRLERSQALNAIRVLARAVDAKDPSTRRHSERVAELAERIAGELGWTPERRALLRGAGLVHDVGKIGVPDSILFKPERLTSGEYEQVKQHARLGAQIVADALSAEQVAWVRGHHEREDGNGYPDGLAADAIPEGARILSVADAWDVMTSARPYAPPIPPDAAIDECRREAGAQFWATAVHALERLLDAGRAPVASWD